MNMHKKRTVALLGLASLLAAGVGCELIVDFDRSKIDGGTEADASMPDVITEQDTGMSEKDSAAPPDTRCV